MGDIHEKMQNYLDNLTKPVGSLGRLESYALKMADIQGKVPPEVRKKGVWVFAGDHGINNEGVSVYPQEVTYQMLRNFVNRGAGINVISKHCGFDVSVVDAGIAAKVDFYGVIDCKVGSGTANPLHQEAMTMQELDSCLENGKQIALKAVEAGYDIVALGDMGISNTSTAAAMLIAAGFDADAIIDRGTGISQELLAHKHKIITQVVKKHAPYADAMDIMRKVGGFELAAMTGFILGLREKKVACMIDGFPVTSGAYMASMLDPEVCNYLFSGHRSKVIGHKLVLDAMGLEPILDLDMRLGEGTGAVLGGFLVNVGVMISREMASFSNAQVSTSTEKEENY